jgi:hypothetical protein
MHKHLDYDVEAQLEEIGQNAHQEYGAQPGIRRTESAIKKPHRLNRLRWKQ